MSPTRTRESGPTQRRHARPCPGLRHDVPRPGGHRHHPQRVGEHDRIGQQPARARRPSSPRASSIAAHARCVWAMPRPRAHRRVHRQASSKCRAAAVPVAHRRGEDAEQARRRRRCRSPPDRRRRCAPRMARAARAAPARARRRPARRTPRPAASPRSASSRRAAARRSRGRRAPRTLRAPRRYGRARRAGARGSSARRESPGTARRSAHGVLDLPEPALLAADVEERLRVVVRGVLGLAALAELERLLREPLSRGEVAPDLRPRAAESPTSTSDRAAGASALASSVAAAIWMSAPSTSPSSSRSTTVQPAPSSSSSGSPVCSATRRSSAATSRRSSTFSGRHSA